MKHIISLGAGVQSSTMALLAAHGEIKPMPEAAIFADVGWEPMAVYEWLEFLIEELPFPVHIVKAGGKRFEDKTIRHRILEGTARDTKDPIIIPVFIKNGKGGLGMFRRQCTRDWKIRPIQKKAKELAGLKKYARLPTKPVITQWIGISLDEIVRAKPSRDPWCVNRHPLAYELQMRRRDCLHWMKDHGYPEPPRSACLGCPYHDNYEWWQIRQDEKAWNDVLEVDRKIRNAGGMKGQVFLHFSGQPLEDAVPVNKPVRKEDNPVNLQLFGECEGMCGV